MDPVGSSSYWGVLISDFLLPSFLLHSLMGILLKTKTTTICFAAQVVPVGAPSHQLLILSTFDVPIILLLLLLLLLPLPPFQHHKAALENDS